MTIRSKLFATVALPVLSITLAIQPVLAESITKPFEVAQDNSEQSADPSGDGQAQPEELRKKRKKQAEPEAEQARPSDDEQQAQPDRKRKKRQDAEQQPAEEARPSGDDAAAEPSNQEKKRAREERRKQAQAAEQPNEEAQPAAPEKKRKKKQQDAEQQPAEQAQPADDAAAQQAVEDKLKAREERRKKARDAEQQQSDEARPADEAKPADKKRKKQQDAQQPAEDVQPAGDDAAAQQAIDQKLKAREERRKKAQDAEQQPSNEAQPSDDAASGNSAEDRKRIRAEQKARADAENQGDDQPNNGEGALRPTIDADSDGDNADGGRKKRKPAEAVVDKRSDEEKQDIAKDPSRSDETVVLPVENGAAVLDSDKDADNAGGQTSRDKRRKQREQERAQDENVEVPKSDAEAQSRHEGRDKRPTREELGEAINERGRRIDEAPAFGLPDLIDAVTGNDGRRPRVEEDGDRQVYDFGDEIIVRSDDRPRLRRNAERTYYDELPRGRTRETIERPGGVQIVTIYNRYGDIQQRSRIDRDGREYLMIYAPEADEGPRPPVMADVGEDLPPMRLRVPVQDYIIDTSTQPDRDYYDFLAEPPVEQVERVYTIDEVKNSARIRDKVRRIDLDTITFATGSAEVPLSQAKSLRKVADAMLEVINKDPGETFFIEGHTDAVGSDKSNLVLSDERAESVASLLTEVYEIPAENLVTQGYGERFLKVRTEDAEQQNRRVTIRRVTPLVRPIAQN